MITICKNCGAALDEAAETCPDCGMPNPWFDQTRRSQADDTSSLDFSPLLTLLTEPFASVRWRRRPARCPVCEAEVGEEAALHCSSCGASLQSILFQDRSGFTLEDIGLLVFVVLFLVFVARWWIEPWVYQVAPDFRATKQGPPEFPVLVHIRQTGLGITNGSAARWSCEIGISFAEIRTAPFTLEPQELRELPYASFIRGSDGLTDADGYTRARQRIRVECRDGSGVSRIVYF